MTCFYVKLSRMPINFLKMYNSSIFRSIVLLFFGCKVQCIPTYLSCQTLWLIKLAHTNCSTPFTFPNHQQLHCSNWWSSLWVCCPKGRPWNLACCSSGFPWKGTGSWIAADLCKAARGVATHCKSILYTMQHACLKVQQGVEVMQCNSFAGIRAHMERLPPAQGPCCCLRLWQSCCSSLQLGAQWGILHLSKSQHRVTDNLGLV